MYTHIHINIYIYMPPKVPKKAVVLDASSRAHARASARAHAREARGARRSFWSLQHIPDS